MKNLCILLTVLLTSVLSAQEIQTDSFRTLLTNDSIVETCNRYKNVNSSLLSGKGYFYLGGGTFVPLGKFKNYYDTSTLIQAEAGVYVTEQKTIDLVAQFIIPNQLEAFTFDLTSSEQLTAQTTTIVNVYLRFNRELLRKNNHSISLGAGIGVSFLNLNVTSSVNVSTDDKEKYEFFSALLVAPNISYKIAINTHDALQLSLQCIYIPYKLNNTNTVSFGNMAFTPVLSYSF